MLSYLCLTIGKLLWLMWNRLGNVSFLGEHSGKKHISFLRFLSWLVMLMYTRHHCKYRPYFAYWEL